MLSRPGYVKINIYDALEKGCSIGKENYKRFVDEKGYLIQNKVLHWLTNLIKRTLDTYETFDYNITHTSNGPAVTLNVKIADSEFAIDLVGCLAFHTDEWWVADKGRSYSGFWNAIPKPIKINALPTTESVATDLQNSEVMQIAANKKNIDVTNATASGVQLKRVKKDVGFWPKKLELLKWKNRLQESGIEKQEENQIVTNRQQHLPSPSVHNIKLEFLNVETYILAACAPNRNIKQSSGREINIPASGTLLLGNTSGSDFEILHQTIN